MLEKVGKNVLSNWTGLGVSMLVAFVMSPFLVHTLGDEQYGIWVLILSVTGYMGLLDGGLKVAVVKFIAGLSAKGDDEALGSIVSTALAVYGVLAIILMCIAVAAGYIIDDLFKLPLILQPKARLVLIIAGATLSVGLLASVSNGFFAGLQRYDITNAVGIGSTLIGALAIYLVVSNGMGIIGLAVVQLSLQTASGLFMYWLARRLRPNIRVGVSQVRLATIRQLYGYSLFVLLNSLAMLLLFRSGEVVVGIMFGAAAVVYFAIGGMLVEYLGRLVGTMTQVLHPLASAQFSTGDVSSLRNVLLISSAVCVGIALPACIGFMVVGKPFIAAWMGPGYAETSGPILAVLAIARLFWLAQSAAGNIMLGVGKHKQLTLFTAGTGLLGISLAVMMAKALGPIGVAAGLAAAIVFCQGILMPIYICRSMDIPMAEYLRRVLAGPLVAAIPFGAALFLLVKFRYPGSVGAVVLTVLACAPLYLAIAYFACLDRESRDRLKGLLGLKVRAGT